MYAVRSCGLAAQGHFGLGFRRGPGTSGPHSSESLVSNRANPRLLRDQGDKAGPERVALSFFHLGLAWVRSYSLERNIAASRRDCGRARGRRRLRRAQACTEVGRKEEGNWRITAPGWQWAQGAGTGAGVGAKLTKRSSLVDGNVSHSTQY